MGANFRNRISMHSMRSHGVKWGLPHFLAGGAGGLKLGLVWRVDFPMFILHLDSGLLMQLFLVWGGGWQVWG